MNGERSVKERTPSAAMRAVEELEPEQEQTLPARVGQAVRCGQASERRSRRRRMMMMMMGAWRGGGGEGQETRGER